MLTGLSSHCRSATLALIAIVAVLRLVYLAQFCPLDLAPDEAYYWDWSRHLDWSYHSKGPLVAWLIRLSCDAFGDTMVAIRLPAVVCGALLQAGLYALTVQIHRNDKLGFGVVAVSLTLPIVAAGSVLMTTDAPFIAAWTWALVFGHQAVIRQERWSWPAAGVCILVGVLAKHTMVLWLPSFAVFLLTTPEMRVQLKRPGFWIMTAIGCLGAVPILAWNVSHGWVTLWHTQVHAGLEGNDTGTWLGPLQYVGIQFAVLMGLWFIIWARAMWDHRPTREADPGSRFLWWMSAPVFVFFGLFSVMNGGGGANWPLASYLSGMVLAAGWLRRAWLEGSERFRRYCGAAVAACAAFGFLLIGMLHEPVRVQPILLSLAGPATSARPMPIRRVDPTCRLRGWRHLAAEVDRVRADLRQRSIEPVLAAERWTQAAELGFYCTGRPGFHCLAIPLGDRDSQYDLWRPNPVADAGEFQGRTFLLVGLDLERLRPAFGSFETVRTVSHDENGCLVMAWSIVVAHDFRGWSEFNHGVHD
jgi:4-amino-4-deoxy-L-arabinose transferase-like glycosyltransferase